MRTSIKIVTTSLCAILSLLPLQAVHGQDATLDRVQALLDNGQTEQARAMLQQWHTANNTLDQAITARAVFLGARLTMSATEAEESYLRVALNHPTSTYAAESLLRLGQARLASGDARQAAVYLQRLLADYPRSEQRPLASVWLARAQAAAGRANVACATIRSALETPRLDNETAALLRSEQTSTCSAAPDARIATTTSASIAAGEPAAATRERAKPPAPVPAATGKFTIQVAAFRQRAGAITTVRQLEHAGFSGARLATVPDNALIRVRLGNFQSSTAAAAQLKKLKAAGFNALIVGDAHRETALR